MSENGNKIIRIGLILWVDKVIGKNISSILALTIFIWYFFYVFWIDEYLTKMAFDLGMICKGPLNILVLWEWPNTFGKLHHNYY